MADKVAAGQYMGSAIQMPTVDDSQVADYDNPRLLKQQGWALVNSGDAAQASRGQDMINRAGQIEHGDILPEGKTGGKYYGYQQLARSRGQNDQIAQSQGRQVAAKNGAAETFAQQYPSEMQIISSLYRANQIADPERLGEAWADVVGRIRSVPWLRDTLSDKLKQYQDATDEAHKQTARLAIEAALGANMISHAPAAALRQANMTVPDPTKGAGARYDLTAQLLALQWRTAKYYSDWNKYKDRVQDIAKFDTDWAAENPIGRYEGMAYDRLAPYPGMTPQEMMVHPRRPKSPDDLKGLRSGVPYEVRLPNGQRKIMLTP